METREDLIKRHWHNYRGDWPRDKDGRPYPELCLPVLHPVPAEPVETKIGTPSAPDTLRFRIERGTMDGLPSERVVCEGVVVDGPFPIYDRQ